MVSAIWVVMRSCTCSRRAKDVDQAGQLRQARDPAVVAGDVAHVRLAHERDHVVLAQRGEGDVPHHHHLVVLGRERHREMAPGIVVDPGEQLLVHARPPVAASPAALRAGDPPRWRLEQLGHEPLDPLDDRRSSGTAQPTGTGPCVDADVGQVAVALGDIEPVTHHEIGGDVETDVAEVELRHGWRPSFTSSAHTSRLAGSPRQQAAPQIRQREPAVDDVLDHQHVAVGEVGVEVLHDPDHAARAWWPTRRTPRP